MTAGDHARAGHGVDRAYCSARPVATQAWLGGLAGLLQRHHDRVGVQFSRQLSWQTNLVTGEAKGVACAGSPRAGSA